MIHKLYVGLRFRLVYMGCREHRYNRHTVSLLTDCMVVSPKVNRIRGARCTGSYSSAGFGDFEIIEQCSDGFLMKKIFFKYRIGRAIESVKLSILGIIYSPPTNKKVTLLNGWWR